ncbi:MAG: STAS domain-containing protein [Acidimicrobiales bacterium]
MRHDLADSSLRAGDGRPASSDGNTPPSVARGAADQAGEFGVAVDGGGREGEAVLRLQGELDIATVGALDEAVESLAALGLPTVVVDVSALTFIDSSGLHRLVVLLKRQREHGGEVVLRAPPPQVVRVLEIVGLTRVMKID